MQDQIIARIQVREKELGRYWVMQNAPDFEKMFDDYIVYWQSQVKLIDDALPVISPEFGAGIIGACYGAEVVFDRATSWNKTIEGLMDNPEIVKYYPESEAGALIKKGQEYFIENNQGRCLVGVIATSCPTDILYLLRGNEIYTDFVDNPGLVKRLLAQIAEGIFEYCNDIWQMVALYEGGIFNRWLNWWLPGRVGMIGDDIYSSCSIDHYMEFGYPVHQMIAERFGKVWYHLHSVGLHLLPAISKIDNVICLELSEDPNVELQGLALLKKVREVMPAEIVIRISVRPQEFEAALDSGKLTGNVIYDVCEQEYRDVKCWDIGYANSLMEKVRKYRTTVS